MSAKGESVSIRPGKRAPEPAERPRGSKAVDKSTRVSHACELCREKRARCNGERPSCQRCTKLGVECYYGLAKNDKRRKEVEDLQSQVAAYESLFDSVIPTLDRKARERLLALRHDTVQSILPDEDQSSAHNAGSGVTSIPIRSPPDFADSAGSSPSMSGNVAFPYSSKQTPLPASHAIIPYQPISYSSPDQLSPTDRKQSSVASTHSLTNSVAEWQKGFIYTVTEGVVPPRDVTESAIKAFFAGSTILFEFFEREEMDNIFHIVYETQSSPDRTIALCQLCIAAAVGCQYDWDQFPDDSSKSYLAVAKLYVEDVIESHALSAMRVMALLALYFTFEKRVSSLVYVDSGLSIARAQKIDVMIPTTDTRKWKRIWCSLVFLSCWISATIGRHPAQINRSFHPSMLNFGNTSNSMADVTQLEVCKIALLTGRILRDVYHAPSVDTVAVNMYKAELESWLFSLPPFMRIDSLLTNGSNEMPMRPIFLVHLLYLTAMTLIYRRIISEFADNPESLISSTTMEDVKNHLDACLWTSRQVSRILNVAMLNDAVLRKCWMFNHATYCANNILLYFAANKLLQSPGTESVSEDLTASEQCIHVLEYCAVADESALQFLKHMKPLHIALGQMHMISRTTAPSDVIPISNLISEYLGAPRPNILVGDDLAQMQRTVVTAIETLLRSPEQRAKMQRSVGSRKNSTSSYPDPETGMPVPYQSGGDNHSAADSLQNYFWDDSLGQQAFKRE